MDSLLVLNEQCGALRAAGGGITPSAIRAAFAEQGENVTIRLVRPADFEPALREAVREQWPAVLVGGGDGSVSTAAQAFVGSNVPLGVLPLGTLNHFAHDLGFDGEWREAAAALARAEPRSVDVGEVNGRVFVNNCSLGAYPEAVLRRDAIRRRGGHKWVAMTLAMLAEFWRLRRIRFELRMPGRTTHLRTPFVLIANNRYSGHVLSSRKRAQLDAGELWTYTTRATGRFQLLRLAWRALVDRIDAADALETHTFDAAAIDTRYARLPVGVDGEVVHLSFPLRLRIRRRALRVLAPASR